MSSNTSKKFIKVEEFLDSNFDENFVGIIIRNMTAESEKIILSDKNLQQKKIDLLNNILTEQKKKLEVLKKNNKGEDKINVFEKDIEKLTKLLIEEFNKRVMNMNMTLSFEKPKPNSKGGKQIKIMTRKGRRNRIKNSSTRNKQPRNM
jgi:hypothetical protein